MKNIKQEMKKNKEVAVLLLKAQGKDYDKWLNEQHLALINCNSEVVERALALFVSHNNGNKIKPIQDAKGTEPGMA